MTRLQRRLKKAIERDSQFHVAIDMGISVATLWKMVHWGTVPKHKRVQKAIENYLEGKGI